MVTPKRDPAQQSVMTEYPHLPYAKATRFNKRLYEGERLSATAFVAKYTTFVPVWEFGYYFLTDYIDTAVVNAEGALAASLFAEGYMSLRASFLVALNGYQSDGISSIRRSHESFIRALACRRFPQKAHTIVRSSDIRRAERDLGIDLTVLYHLESGFAHSNHLRSGETMVAISSKAIPPSEYGPHSSDRLHDFLSKVAIFWQYFAIRTVPIVIPPRRDHATWLNSQEDVLGLLVGYLRDSGSDMADKCMKVDAMVERMAPKS